MMRTIAIGAEAALTNQGTNWWGQINQQIRLKYFRAKLSVSFPALFAQTFCNLWLASDVPQFGADAYLQFGGPTMFWPEWVNSPGSSKPAGVNQFGGVAVPGCVFTTIIKSVIAQVKDEILEGDLDIVIPAGTWWVLHFDAQGASVDVEAGITLNYELIE